MKRLHEILDNLQEKESLGRVRPVVEAINSLLFRPGEDTPSAPHIADGPDTGRYYMLLLLALMPITIAAIYFFGWRALAMILVSYISGGLTEVLFVIFRKKKLQIEGLLVTGLIFPLILPPTLPLWIVAVGSVFGVFFGKEVFGGTGRNIFHPALVGRLFIMIAFPTLMTTVWQLPLLEGLGGFLSYPTDLITSATPLISYQGGEMIAYPSSDLLLGRIPGSQGETFRLGIIVAGLFLMLNRVIDWRIPAAMLGSVAIFSSIGHFFMPAQVAPPLFQLLVGGLLFGTFFIATDPVTSPFTDPGKWLFGISVGLLIVLIRGFSINIEGVTFSIILMNASTPLIDKLFLKTKMQPARKREVI